MVLDGLVLAYAKVLNEHNIDYQKDLFIDVTDISSTCVYMTYIQLALYGIPAINMMNSNQNEIIVDKTIQNKFKEVMIKGNSQISLF